MKKDQAPQDNSEIYQGKTKLLYVTDEQGEYDTVTSSGWDVEEVFNGLAIEDINELTEEARQACLSGEQSILPYLMYKSRLDVAALSQATGLFQWRIRRHFKPEVYNKLSDKILSRYAEILGMTLQELKDANAK